MLETVIQNAILETARNWEDGGENAQLVLANIHRLAEQLEAVTKFMQAFKGATIELDSAGRFIIYTGFEKGK